LISVYFQKSVEKSQVSLKSEKHNKYFTRTLMYIYDISSNSYHEQCFRHCIDNQNTNFGFNIFFPKIMLFM
jgi:hypothetical protein